MRTVATSAGENLQVAAEHGRICAIATTGQRDLAEYTSAYPELFPVKPFDPAFFAAVSLASAFSAPWCTPEQLRLTNRAAVWVRALRWSVHHRAGSEADVEILIDRCRAVAHGVPAGEHDELGRFLADLLAQLLPTPGFAARRDGWRAELERTLNAIGREWRWMSADRARPGASRPTLREYLDNADSLGSTFVHLTHWLRLGDSSALAHLNELITVSREAQRVLRLVDDLTSASRGSGRGDFDALLTADRSRVEEQVGHLVDRCRELLRPLEVRCPNQASYLARQLGFNSGFHRIADFWGNS
ncbi:terpene synthase family protein [Micromonospora sp. LOL_023]|uniref:terpene synthase family protein n=1 Tax=Micromonospora sp. LOL_023 TaxID=3345418 RepID=UPI003A853600